MVVLDRLFDALGKVPKTFKFRSAPEYSRPSIVPTDDDDDDFKFDPKRFY